MIAAISFAGTVFVIIGLSSGTGGFINERVALPSWMNASLVIGQPTVIHDVAQIVIIRHGEKDHGTGLSDVGAARAQYIARCMSTHHSSTALPRGPPTYVMASHGHPGNSHRPRDTVAPVARALGLSLDDSIYFKDAATFAEHVMEKLRPRMTMLVAWHHEEIPKLISRVLGMEDWKLASLHWPDRWPSECGSRHWDEPSSLEGSTCYDLLWRLTMTRATAREGAASEAGRTGSWRVTALTASLQGFRGDANGPCLDGLTPYSS
jgi:hypothetical protein